MTHPRPHRLTWVLLSIAILLVLVALGIWMGSSPSMRHQITLKDGRIVELLGVTSGSEHTLQKRGPGAFLHRLIPAPLKKAFGPDLNSTFGFGHADGIALWLMCYDPAQDAYATSWINKVIVFDEHGCGFASVGQGHTGDGYHHVTLMHLPAYPRRQPTFKARLIQSTSGQDIVLGEITLRNPGPTEFPQWTPEPIPVTKSNGPVAVRLVKVEAGKLPSTEFIGVEGREREWTLSENRYHDATGNSGLALCTNEKAWKYEATLFRTEYASFTTNELWTLANTVLPAPGSVQPIHLTNSVSGAEISVLYLVGPGTYTFSNSVCIASARVTTGQLNTTSGGRATTTTFGAANPTLILAHRHFGSDDQLLVRIRQGDQVVAFAKVASGSPGLWFHTLSWSLPQQDLPPPNTPLDLDLIVQKGKHLEFLVPPPTAGPLGDSAVIGR